MRDSSLAKKKKKVLYIQIFLHLSTAMVSKEERLSSEGHTFLFFLFPLV